MQDKKTIELLFRKHYGRMLLTARTLLRNQEEAEDVVGDVFETLMYSQQELDMNHVESFLLVSVRNTCLNRIRHRMAAERARRQQTQEAAEEAYAELQSIVRRMENDELDIDQLTAQLKRAQQLIKLCKDKLTKTDEDIKKILEEQEQ